MNMTDALSENAGLEGSQWMLTGPPHWALRRELSALLLPPTKIGPCRLRLARLKPGRRFTASYDVHVGIGGYGHGNVRPIAVNWKLTEEGSRRKATEKIKEAEAEAMSRGLMAPFRKLAVGPSSGLSIQVFPLDPDFPQLVRICDPQYVREMVASHSAVSDEVPHDAPSQRYSVTPIRYRPGKRHVLRYDPQDASAQGAIFAKLYNREDGPRILRIAKQITAWLVGHGGGAVSAQSPVYVAEDSVILYPEARGIPLSERMRRPGQSLMSDLKSAGTALHALHLLPSDLTGPLELRDFGVEIKEIAQASDHVCALLPQVGVALEALLDRAQEVHERLPLESPAFTYGEMKAEHVWITPDGVSLIDFDGCCMSDPALDVGKFLADLRYWCAVFRHQGVRQLQEQFLAGYGPGAPVERLVRASLYESIELVKLAVHRARRFEHGWARRTISLIGDAQFLLDQLCLSLGLPQKWPLSLGALGRVSRPQTTPSSQNQQRSSEEGLG